MSLDAARPILALLATLGSGLIAGVFFAFSTFVMRALARLPAADGLAAMQSINVVVLNPLFLGLFLGTVLLSLGAIGDAAWRWNAPGSAWLIAGATLYLVGTFGVTIACNVPLNDALAKVAATDADAAARWTDYVATWTRWNHVRTVAAIGATTAFALSLAARR